MIDYSKLKPGFYFATEKSPAQIDDALKNAGAFQCEFFARISGEAPFLKLDLFDRFNWSVVSGEGKTLAFMEA